jgi:hypothetical protein
MSFHQKYPSRRTTLPGTVSAFRILGPGGASNDPGWFADDMGGPVDPDGPRPTRRDFLIRAAVAAGAVAVGGAINLLTTALARQSLDERRLAGAGTPEGERR